MLFSYTQLYYKNSKFHVLYVFFGGLAQLARAPALHAGGHRFDSDILHNKKYIDILELIEVVNK